MLLEIKNNLGYAQAYTYLGDLRFKTNDSSDAEQLLQKSLTLDPKARMAIFDLGCIYADQDKRPEALAALEQAVALDPTQPDAHYRLARLYTRMGEKDKAAKEFPRTKSLHAKTDDTLIQKISGQGAVREVDSVR